MNNNNNDNGGNTFEGDGIVPKPIKNHIYNEMYKREIVPQAEPECTEKAQAELERAKLERVELERAELERQCAQPPISQIAFDFNNYNKFAPAEAVSSTEYEYIKRPENINRVCGEREQPRVERTNERHNEYERREQERARERQERAREQHERHKSQEHHNEQRERERAREQHEQQERQERAREQHKIMHERQEHTNERREHPKTEHPEHKNTQKGERHEYRKIERMNERNEIHKNSPYNYYSCDTLSKNAPKVAPEVTSERVAPTKPYEQFCAPPEYAPIYDVAPQTPAECGYVAPPYAQQMPTEYAPIYCAPQPPLTSPEYMRPHGELTLPPYREANAPVPAAPHAVAAHHAHAAPDHLFNPCSPHTPSASDAAYKPDYEAMKNNPDITAKYDMSFVDNSVPMENNPMGNMLTGAVAAPVDSDQSTISTDVRGCQLLQDVYAVEKLAHFNRERIPERVVHANGSGAFGVFEVTNDLSKYTCAKIFSRVGKKTEMAARFSSVAAEKGGAQSVRDPRGFALKFYTEEGNYDIVGNDTPVFFIRDTIKFPDFIHSQKRNPANNLHEPDYVWDFFSLTPESIHQVTFLYSSRGIPLSFRHMDGFGANTFMWYNEKGEHVWVKYHFKTNQGIKNLTQEEADELAGRDPDSATRDLYDSIERGDYPSWNAYVQIMTPKRADEYMFDAFDVTKVWFHKDFPLIPLGKFTLNRNPKNFFAEVEQLAFCPANMVRGIAPSFDKMLQGRMFGYLDTQRHRLGANFQQIPVNMPKGATPNTNQRDGNMTVNGNFGGNPNYFPSSFINNTTSEKYAVPEIAVGGSIKRHKIPITDADFIQAGELYRRVLDTKEKDYLIHNILLSLKLAKVFIQYRQCALFYKADADYGTRVAKGLNLDAEKVKRLSRMTQEQRIEQTKGMM
jgi:catalase